ncbi:MAG: hydrogenase formation protein HypD [bacterium]|nr:hydrogenase formation protein HypD [bacterium]
MKYVEEYRDPEAVHKISEEIHRITRGSWNVMEVCGGQTHAIMKYGIEELLPKSITMLHGPGCPVCVTPVELIDKAIAIAAQPGVIFCSFGDMLRVPGTQRDLLAVKASGGDVRMVYSPLDALNIARECPYLQVVFFAIGFETTAPANAMAVYQARQYGIDNFSVLVSQVLIPPAIELLLNAPQTQISAFLAPGHVCSIIGYEAFESIAAQYHTPIVVTGFEPVDILSGILHCIQQLESGRAVVENQYSRAVQRQGNPAALKMMNEVYIVSDRKWRGIGFIPRSGLTLSDKYAAYDAERCFGAVSYSDEVATVCISGTILQGIKKPRDCPAFGNTCTPENPLGATMVSSEGACAAYYAYAAHM